MEILFSDIAIPTSGAAVIFTREGLELTGSASDIDGSLGNIVGKVAASSRFEGKKGSTLDITAPAGSDFDRILVVGLGKDALSNYDIVSLGATVTAKLAQSGSGNATIFTDINGLDAAAIAEGALLRSYRFDKYRTKEPASKKPTLNSVTIASADTEAAARFEARKQVTDGVFLTRDLVSEPANILYPESFAGRIRELSVLV